MDFVAGCMGGKLSVDVSQLATLARLTSHLFFPP